MPPKPTVRPTSSAVLSSVRKVAVKSNIVQVTTVNRVK